MGTEWYLLCDDDMTAYQLGKGAWQIATAIHEGKRGVELDAEMREWLEGLGDIGDVNFDEHFYFVDAAAYCASTTTGRGTRCGSRSGTTRTPCASPGTASTGRSVRATRSAGSR